MKYLCNKFMHVNNLVIFCLCTGVDVVLNSLAEEKLQASLRCLARHGRFLEIGKYDLSNNTPLGEFTGEHITLTVGV